MAWPPKTPPTHDAAKKSWVSKVLPYLLLFGIWFVCNKLPNPLFGPRSDGSSAIDSRSLQGVAQDADHEALEKRLAAGADPNAKDGFGHPLIVWARDAKSLEILLRHGADPEGRDHYNQTPLMKWARDGDVEAVKVLLAAGAKVDATNPEWGEFHTPMVDAVTGGNEEVIRLLRQAGAVDYRVSEATGVPLPEDGGIPFSVARQYFLALHARDREGAARVRAGSEATSNVEMSEEDWNNVLGARPVDPQFGGGFHNGHHATLKVTGFAPGGFAVVWELQLMRITAEQAPLTPEAKNEPVGAPTGEWRIVREDWQVD